MVSGKDGFLYPNINVETCIKCLACEKTCPVIIPIDLSGNKSNPEVFACWNKDSQIRSQSSSGGAFSALASAILEEDGIVVGASYNNQMQVAHKACFSFEDLDSLRGSKYVQSSMGEIYKSIRSYLNKGKRVLFVGTPCQNAGIKKFLKREYVNLYCCDFICHGTPSPLLFQKYLKWIEKSKGIKVTSFNFRSKKSGWYDALRVVNNHEIMKGKYDAYFFGFNRNFSLRESCYNCPEIGMPRRGDITIADFWGIGMTYRFDKIKEIKDGISLVMINNAKGELLFESAKPFLEYRKGYYDEALSHNIPMIEPSPRPIERETFYLDMESMDFEALRKKYLRVRGKAKIVAFAREYIPRFIITNLRDIVQFIKWKLNGSKTL